MLRQTHLKFFKGCIPQILLAPFLISVTQTNHAEIFKRLQEKLLDDDDGLGNSLKWNIKAT